MPDHDPIKTLLLNESEQKIVAEEITILSDPSNPGSTTGLSKLPPRQNEEEQRGLSRRAFMAIGIAEGAALVAATTGVVGVGGPLIQRWTWDSRTDRDLFDRPWGIELDQSYMEFIEEGRHKPDLIKNSDAQFGYLGQSYKFLTRLIQNFDEGNYAFTDELDSLEHLLGWLPPRVPSRTFLGNLLASEYVRAGRGEDAKRVLKSIGASLEREIDRLTFMEKTFSVHYVTLKDGQYLAPREWGFEDGFPIFNDTVGAAVGLEFTRTQTGAYMPKAIPHISEKQAIEVAKAYKFEGVNSLFLALHYIAASADAHELSQIADLEYRLFRTWAQSNLPVQRTTWNMLFITAMQLYRRDRPDKAEAFVKAALDDQYWKSDIRAELNRRAGNFDMIPICFSFLVNSRTALRGKLKLPENCDPRLLSGGRDRVAPQRLQAALDLVPKNAGLRAPRPLATKTYLVGDGTLSVYLDDFTKLKEALKHL